MKRSFLIAALAILSACETPTGAKENGPPDGSTGLEPGQMSTTVSGDLEHSMNGEAMFFVIQGFAGPIFSIELDAIDDHGDSLALYTIDLTATREEPPAPGSYEIGAVFGDRGGRFSGGYTEYKDEVSRFMAQSGTLNVVSSDSGHVEGWFVMDAINAGDPRRDQSDSLHVQVAGKFNAKRGEVGVYLN
ncbi:MAG TPA: hypothetical protein VFG50_01270 [Rhodothermales bacterium]|nr:hypothetical protein [Rhodothermales bacterium]